MDTGPLWVSCALLAVDCPALHHNRYSESKMIHCYPDLSHMTADLCRVLCVCAGVEDDSCEPVLRSLWLFGDLPPGCHGGLSPQWGQAAGLPQGLCGGLSRGPGGCCNDHSPWQVRGRVFTCSVSLQREQKRVYTVILWLTKWGRVNLQGSLRHFTERNRDKFFI